MSDLTLNVAMIGPRGCGKTSVLSIMLGEIENFINKLNGDPDVREYCAPNVKADGFSIETLRSSYDALQSVATRNVLTKGVNVLITSGTHRVYNIDLSVSGITTTISFHDFPGAYFIPENHKNIRDSELENCHDVFEKADVIILCVDVPSQITYPDASTNKIFDSYTRYITELIKESLERESLNNIKKTVMVLPIKCEGAVLATRLDPYNGYTQSIDRERSNELYKKVKNLYKDLFTYLKNSRTVDSFYLPVITMGCVKATGMEYNPETGSTHVAFGPIIKNQDLHYYQCNSSSLTALCLWSAEAIITQKYVATAGIVARIRRLFKGKWPTEWFREELFKECSLSRIRWDYISVHPDYIKLSEEEKKKFNDLKSAAESQPFTGCRRI